MEERGGREKKRGGRERKQKINTRSLRGFHYLQCACGKHIQRGRARRRSSDYRREVKESLFQESPETPVP